MNIYRSQYNRNIIRCDPRLWYYHKKYNYHDLSQQRNACPNIIHQMRQQKIRSVTYCDLRTLLVQYQQKMNMNVFFRSIRKFSNITPIGHSDAAPIPNVAKDDNVEFDLVNTENQEQENTSTIPPVGKRFFVHNLAWGVTTKNLLDHIKFTTQIQNVRGFDNTYSNGKSKGWCIVEFANEMDAQLAVEKLNGTQFRGRLMYLRDDEKEPTVPVSLRVSNLNETVTWGDLKDHLAPAGNVHNSYIVRYTDGRSRGIGIVEFLNPEEAQKALSTFHDTELKGQKIHIQIDTQTVLTSVFVSNIPLGTELKDLVNHMESVGTIDSTKLHPNIYGKCMHAVVVYQNRNEAIRSMRKLNRSKLNGQIIFVREDRAN